MEIKKIKSAVGTLTVPGDKSISHRAVMLASLADGVSTIEGFLPGADCLSTIDCFRKMGIHIDFTPERVTVYGEGMHGLKQPTEQLYTGNSGTTTRLLCGILAAQPFDCSITGDASIQKRPMKRVVQPLSLMGAQIDGDYCPLTIHGTQITGTQIDMTVASAQVKTAIILAGLYADGDTVVRECEKSRDHTERMLSSMGANIQTNGLEITVKKTEHLKPSEFKVPGDISSAAFFMVLGAIMPNSRVTVQNTGLNETRTGIVDVLDAMGANMEISNKRIVNGEEVGDITVSSSKLHGVRIDGSIIPRLIDELPVIAAAAVFAEGETVIADAQELKVKETNRIRAVVDEFTKCGADVTETDDGMIIRGGTKLHGADFKTYGDHRMAMTLTILAQLAEGVSTIDDDACVSVSYPNFFDDFYGLGESK